MTRELERRADCGMCAMLADGEPLYADELWQVRPIAPPWGVAGWLLMISQRHCAGPAHMDDAEAAGFGPALRRFEAALEQATGAERIYTAALGESQRHLHVHMVPRMADGPRGWGLFDLERAAHAGEITVDPAEAEGVHRAFVAALGSGSHD